MYMYVWVGGWVGGWTGVLPRVCVLPSITNPRTLNRLDFDEETHGDAFLAPKGFRDSQGALRANYASLRRAVTAATTAAAASSMPPAAAAPPAAVTALGGGGAMAVEEGAQGPVLSVGSA